MKKDLKNKKTPLFTLQNISISVVIFASLAIFFSFIWYERFLRWDFNELGRYYDPESETVYTESGFIWGIPAVFFSAMTIRCILLRKK